MTIFTFIKEIIKQNKGKMLLLLILMISSSLAPVFTSISVKNLTDNYIATEDYYLSIFAISILLLSTTYAIEEIVRQLLTYQSNYICFQKLFHEITLKSYSFFLKNNSGELSAHTNQISNFHNFILMILRILFLLIPTLVSISAFYYIHHTLLIFLFIWFTITLILMTGISYLEMKYNKKNMKISAKFNGNLNEIMKNYITTFSYFNPKRETNINNSYIEKIKNINFYRFILLLAKEVVFVTSMITIFFGILYINYKLESPLGTIIFSINSSFGIFWRSVHVFYSLSYLLEEYSKYSVSFQRIMQTEPNTDSNEIQNIYFNQAHITINDLNFKYDEKITLKNINLDIPAQSKIAIVGPSGSGKSTLVSLIAKLLNTSDNSIRINNQDINKIHKHDIMSNISYVSQNIQLMSRSIRENISGDKEELLSDAELDIICKNAQAYDFISELPDKYDTMLIEGGSNLSGGQKQRIGIARALAKNGSIIIFDEANSALDYQTNHDLQKTILKLFKDKTCIFISHKIKELSGMDQIVFLKNGSIIEKGTHQELINKQGEYFKLYYT